MKRKHAKHTKYYIIGALVVVGLLFFFGREEGRALITDQLGGEQETEIPVKVLGDGNLEVELIQ